MALSIADYLLQLPENMNFAKVQELSGEDSLYYRMLSDYGSGSFQLIRFENDLLMILIADYTPKETFEKIATDKKAKKVTAINFSLVISEYCVNL